MKKTTLLLILDGFGYRAEAEGNAIKTEGVKNISRLATSYPHTFLSASGLSVGLPDGQMGNSEVGHLNMGAGRVIYQDLTRIDHAIQTGEFKRNEALNYAIDNGNDLHIMGLCSSGGVHSHIQHLKAILSLCAEHGRKNVYVHCFTDGRDTPVESGLGYVEEAMAACAAANARIATVTGRFYAMDRDKRFDRVKLAYDAMCFGEGSLTDDPLSAIRASYAAGVTDEFIKPIVVTNADGSPVATIKDGDSVIFYNFRPDRAREITAALIMDNFSGFDRRQSALKLHYVAMSHYEDAFDGLLKTAFAPENIVNTLGEYVSDHNMLQLRIAETEKYAHVTFFFNGGREEMFRREDRALIPSPKVATYDMAPQMSAFTVTDEAVRRIDSGVYDLIIMNLANCDMVGHTGDMDATLRAVAVVDECVDELAQAVLRRHGGMIITADHGNAEYMLDENGAPCTYHTTSKVPFILVDDAFKDVCLRKDGILADIAPTILELMGLSKPSQMTGSSLIIKSSDEKMA